MMKNFVYLNLWSYYYILFKHWWKMENTAEAADSNIPFQDP